MIDRFLYVSLKKAVRMSDFINLFQATGLFLYPLNTSENQRFTDFFFYYFTKYMLERYQQTKQSTINQKLKKF